MTRTPKQSWFTILSKLMLKLLVRLARNVATCLSLPGSERPS